MPPPSEVLSDGGLFLKPIKFTLAGFPYVFTAAKHDKPVKSEYERDGGNDQTGEAPKLIAGFHQKEPEKIAGEIKAYAGVPEPVQLSPFPVKHVDGKVRYWAVGSLSLNFANATVTSYSCELVPQFNAPAA